MEKQYASLRLDCVLDTLDTGDEKSLKTLAPFLRRRSRVVELVCAERMLFALTHVGVCAAFDRDCGRRLCYLNVLDDEVVRSLFYNKANESIITVSVLRSERFSRLHCRSTPLTMLERGTPGEGFPLFEEEMLSWPGFVEFDDVNRKVITFNATTHTYKMWDLANYTLLYSVHDERIEELKMSPGVMLLIYQRTENSLPLKLVSVETGEVLKSFSRMLHRGKAIEFIEQFNSKLLIKQQGHDMEIVDVHLGSTVRVPTSLFPTPNGFIFLFSKNQFITYNKHEVLVWNFEGHLQTRFQNHNLFYPTQSPSIMCVNTSQDVIFSYCREERSTRGNVHISSLDDGHFIGRINRAQLPDQPELRGVLDEITSLTYNETREELYTGGRHGQIHVWSG
jgi:WD40 repeat protein